MRRLYHYTTLSRLRKIVEDGAIKPAMLYVEKSEKPVVWCSFRSDWEPTATPALQHGNLKKELTFDELCKIDTPVRIEIHPDATPLNWRAWRKLSGVKAKIARALEQIAMRQGSTVKDWRMSFEPVSGYHGHWLAIELFEGGQWRNLKPCN